jgi:glycine/D-amino acid oxidase-like deaminating enzyme
MNLHSPYPYWLLRHGIINSYPSLDEDLRTEIVIIGAGISGALVANQLCHAGFKVVMVDRRHAGMGSTAASTSLLQYELDTPLQKLIGMVGEKNAIRSYLLCQKAIHDLGKICDDLKDSTLFTKKPSFQYASFRSHVADLKKEFTLRKQAGLSLQWLDKNSIAEKFGFIKPAGMLSRDGAEADAYKITHSLLQKWLSKERLQVYDQTEIVSVRHHKHNVQLLTASKKKITAKKLVIACGYESQQYIPQKIQELYSTYAICSEPHTNGDFWYKNALIWETSRPYLYFRTTSDKRIIVGGKDILFSNAFKRDRLINQKARAIETSFAKLFPQISFKTDFKWAGTFASTKDGLPYIGTIPQRPHTYFALGFGGNGVTFSAIAADIIRDLLSGKKNLDAAIFSFDR